MNSTTLRRPGTGRLALTTAAAAGVLVALDRRRRRRHHESLEPEDKAVEDDLPGESLWIDTTDGGELYVTRSGPPRAPIVVLAHCWTGSRQTWAPVARRLIEAGCQVVRWDQRGHGRSVAGASGYTLESLADDLAAIVRDLDIHGAVLAGHSMGGMTVQSLATHHPRLFHERVSSVVLVSTAAHGVDNPMIVRAVPVIGSETLRRIARPPVLGKAVVRGTFGPWAYWNHLQLVTQDFIDTPSTVTTQFGQAMLGMDLREGIKGIRVPTTILVGSHDTLTPPPLARRMAALIPEARLHLIYGVGHMMPLENAATVANTILAQLARNVMDGPDDERHIHGEDD